jgi:hypothetical protein
MRRRRLTANLSESTINTLLACGEGGAGGRPQISPQITLPGMRCQARPGLGGPRQRCLVPHCCGRPVSAAGCRCGRRYCC